MSEKIGQLRLVSTDGKKYSTDVGDTETILRLVQSVPSPKAEPFKLWLARVDYERLEETADPELAINRYDKITKDFKAGKNTYAAKTVDELINHLNSL